MSQSPGRSSRSSRPLAVKLDEDLSPLVGEPFSAFGHRVAPVLEQGWSGLPDAQLITKVAAEARMLITADKGFGDIRNYPPGSHTGIVVLRADQESILAYRTLAATLLEEWELADLVGSIVVVTPRGVRVRRPEAPKSRKPK
jgi:hypothetical protein